MSNTFKGQRPEPDKQGEGKKPDPERNLEEMLEGLNAPWTERRPQKPDKGDDGKSGYKR